MDISGVGFCADIACPVCGHADRVHTLLANFRLESVLGIGGMSTVYRARDMVLNRTVAIKVLHDSYEDADESRTRFETEGALMAKVRHENVVSVYSAGWARHHFYLAMELVEGTNMEVLVAERKCLLPGEALELIRQVALGLQAAYAEGVLHRDVKPGNVLITAEGTAKVLDFGLALEDKPMEEKEGIIWATPFYVPPETLRREQEDARSDIYALGMTLRHLLTGSDKLGDPAPQSIPELLEAKKNLPSFAVQYPQLGEALGELIDHMTAFAPEARPASYAEVLEEMAEVQSKVGKGGMQRMRRDRMERRRWLRWAAGGSVAAGLLLALGVALTPRVSYEYEVLTTDTELRWNEWHVYEQAHEFMAQEQLDDAAELFGSLAEHANDPVLGAVSALHAMQLSALKGESAAAQKTLRELFRARAESAAKTMPAWEFLRPLLQQEDKEQLPPGLAMALALSQSHAYAASGRMEEALQCADEAARLAEREENCCAAALRKEVPLFRNTLPRIAAGVQRERLAGALRRGNFTVARDCLRTISRESLSPLEQQELSVQEELCAVADVLFDALRRRKGSAFRADASPDELAALAADMAPAPFRQEVLAIACMLRGDYSRAFLANPYRLVPDSQEPFAVLMRDWKKRLER